MAHLEKRNGLFDDVEKVVNMLKHGHIPNRLVWMIYLAAKQRLMVGKVRKEVD